MRHEIAAIIAVVAIVLTTFVVIRDNTPTSISLEPGITGQVTAQETLPEATLVLASGFVKPSSTVRIEDDGVRLEGGGFLQEMSVDLAGSRNEEVVFRVQNVANPSAYTLYGGAVLASHRGAGGGSYALLSRNDLARLRAQASAPWHVFTAQRSDGILYTIAVRIE